MDVWIEAGIKRGHDRSVQQPYIAAKTGLEGVIGLHHLGLGLCIGDKEIAVPMETQLPGLAIDRHQVFIIAIYLVPIAGHGDVLFLRE